MEERFFYSKYKPKQDNVIESVKAHVVGGFVSESINDVIHLIESKHTNPDLFGDVLRDIVINGINYNIQHVANDQVEFQLLNNYHENIKDFTLENLDFVIPFSKSLFKYSIGEIDGDEMISDTLSSAVISSMSTLGASAFGFMSNSIGFGATIGTAFGPLGTVIGSVLGGLCGNAIVGSAKQEGIDRFKSDLAKVNGEYSNQITIYKYLDSIGSMSEYQFSMKHLIPCYGAIGSFSEYGAKKQILNELKSSLENPDLINDSNYHTFAEEIDNQFTASIEQIRKDISVSRHLYYDGAEEYMAQFAEEVKQHMFSRTNISNLSKDNFIGQVYKYQEAFSSIENRSLRIKDFRNDIASIRQEIDLFGPSANQSYYLDILDKMSDGVFDGTILLPIKQAQQFFS